MMDKLKVYQVVAISLLLINVGLLVFLFLGAPKDGPLGRRPVHEMLDLDAGQNEDFFASARQHEERMKEIKSQQQEVLQKYFLQLTTPEGANPGAVPAAYTTLEQDKVGSTYQHLLEVKGLLTPEQETKFPDFVEEVLPQILGRGKRQPPPPRKRQ